MPKINFGTLKSDSIPTLEQLRIIESHGNVIVTGCPGVGKTYTIARAQDYTYKYITTEVGGRTFSREAKKRWVQELSNIGASLDIEVSTFHSDAYAELDCPELINTTYNGKRLSSVLLNITDDEYMAKQLELAIEQYKTCNKPLMIHEEKWLREYQDYLKRYDLMDYSDLLIRYEQIAKRRYSRLFIDEFQDTSSIQYRIAKKLTEEIVVVNEPYQRIYTWRDADERNELSLRQDYKPLEMPLTISHRHAINIVNFLESIYPRNLSTTKTTLGLVKIVKLSNPDEQVEAIRELSLDGLPTLVLSREKSSLSLPRYVLGKGINIKYDYGYDVSDKPKNFYGQLRGTTIHSIKGQESYRVILIDCNDSIMPHYLSANLIEEKNLFYVACSRATDELYILTHGEPSPYLTRSLYA